MKQDAPIARWTAPQPDDGFGVSLLDLLRLKGRAWLVRHASVAQASILDSRTRVVQAATRAEDAHAELIFRRQLRQAPTAQRTEIAGREGEVERLLRERDGHRRQRLARVSPDGLPALPDSPALVPDISDRQIEALAVKAVTRFAALPAREAEAAWSAWERELEQRLPPYAAAEVAQRAAELRSLLR